MWSGIKISIYSINGSVAHRRDEGQEAGYNNNNEYIRKRYNLSTLHCCLKSAVIGQVIFIHLYELYIQSPESIDGVQSHPTSSNRRNSIGPAAETLWTKRVLMVVREESRNVLVILAIHMRFVWWPKECGSGPTEPPPPPPPPLLARTLVYLRPPKSTGETL